VQKIFPLILLLSAFSGQSFLRFAASRRSLADLSYRPVVRALSSSVFTLGGFMRFARASVGLVVGSLFAVGCGSDSTGPHGPAVTLTAAQATVLMARITELAPVHPELAWLADSANLVLRSGAEADVISLTTDLGAGPFYAIGLQRGVQVSAIAFSTFDLIVFNDPSNPTDFIIVDGFISGTGTPPTSVTGAFGGAVNGHLFQVAGNTVTAWRTQTGTATLSTGSAGSSCAGFASDAGVTCAQSALTAEFNIVSAVQDSGGQTSGTRSASLASTSVAGILLSYHFP
jgi:hypothetical protein